MTESFTTKQAAAFLETTNRTVQFYVERSLLKPEVNNPRGRGKVKRYSRKNLLELAFIRELTLNGFSIEEVKRIMIQLNRGNWETFSHMAVLPTTTHWTDYVGTAGENELVYFILLRNYGKKPQILLHKVPSEADIPILRTHETVGRNSAIIINITKLPRRVAEA